MESLLSTASFIFLYGLSYGVVLFTISVGLVVTMGLMRVVNLAHTAFAAIGGYVFVSLLGALPFPAAIATAVIAVAIFSLLVERLIYVHLYTSNDLDQVLMTIGLLFLTVASLNLFFGPNPMPTSLPAELAMNTEVFGREIQVYRLFIIGSGGALLTALWLLFYRTRFGAMLRAAVDNRSMAEATGINVNIMFSAAFALGSGLAALGGAIGYAILPLEPMYPFKYLTLVLIVVTISGVADIKASAAAAVLVGIIDTACRYLYPASGTFLIYFILLGITAWRNRGLIPGRTHL